MAFQRRYRSAALFAILTALSSPVLAQTAKPWTIDVEGALRQRYETVANSFRPATTRRDELVTSRTLLHVRATKGAWTIGGELMDSRAWADSAVTPLGTDDVNALEPLQAYVSYRQTDLVGEGDRLQVTLGRQTINLASRRFVSRNGFRNTINGFNGLRSVYSRDNTTVNAFFVLPVVREPFDRPGLADNDVKLDSETVDTHFYGGHFSHRFSPLDLQLEAYFFRLREQDRPRINTSNRRLNTLGGRVLRAPADGQWDYEVEGAYQWGQRRATSSVSDVTDLRHRAGFLHAELGYSFAQSGIRLELQYDHATGDDDPTDERSGGFDTLFGSRRFDYGHTGIYGAFARNNFTGPGLAVFVTPEGSVTGNLRYRAVWLAEARDDLSTGGPFDPTGDAGRFVGQQLDVAVNWDLFGERWSVEVGGALLFKGRFLKQAGAPDQGGTTVYGYVMSTVRF